MIKNKKLVLIYIVLFIFVLVNSFIMFTSFNSLYLYLKPLLLGFFAGFVYLYNPVKDKNKNKHVKNQNIILIVLVYLFIYFMSGLIFSFAKNGLDLSFLGIINNLYIFFIALFFEEYIRYNVISSEKKSFNIILITIMLILMNINIYLIKDCDSVYKLIEFFMKNVFAVLISNITYSYIAYSINYKANYIYRGIVSLVLILSPILPLHEYIITIIFDAFAFISVYLSIHNIVYYEDKRNRKGVNKKKEKKFTFTLVVEIMCVLLLYAFMLGIFKYKPVAIMSNSMKGYFSRGDTVIVNKVNEEEKKKLAIGDVIYYQHENVYITHRIIDVYYEDGVVCYITQGDNNDYEDNWVVYSKDIKGKVEFVVKYIGWPSVLMSGGK